MAAPAAPADYNAGDPDAEAPENLVAKFQILAAEGDLLAQRGSWAAAIEAYTRALAIRPADKHCLVSRSRCHINSGNGVPALRDAELSLKEDPEFFKGVYQKAEALYAIGDFETALVFYHRGNRLRPELDEFRTGIQKAREAIENGIGNPKDTRITVPQNLRRQLAAAAAVEQEAASDPSTRKANAGKDGDVRTTGRMAFAVSGPGAGGGGGAGGDSKSIASAPTATAGFLTPALESKLLGELYEDKMYLEELLSDRDFTECPDEQVMSLVADGIRYLGTRIDFWRQQNPIYARPKERRIRPRMERGGLKPRSLSPDRPRGGKGEADAKAAGKGGKAVARPLVRKAAAAEKRSNAARVPVAAS
ncbi:Tetratricopeptide repeat protein 25 [Geranomyces variabilis]|uniref:Outer dynein arm-docking complex subunit 4 n=1 Tax=Geranomyces variabilis TaxID=109894 RepID=A0AAD5TDA0_9FUNG|nr:Tetratricopeptide repeat protein 25 [Geranomyces variabilis]